MRVNSIFFYFEVVRICSFVCCNGVCKSGVSSTKTKIEWYTPTRHKGIYWGLFSINSFSFCCAIYSTIVQIERTRKDLPRAYICCRTEFKTSLALSLRTNCLRKFRYYMNESSITQFNCNQIPHILTF